MYKKIVGIFICMLFIGTNFSIMSKITITVKADITDGLVGYWNFNEGSGSIAHDTSGYGNDGTINGATWASGIYGGALNYDGNDYVVVPDDSSLNTYNSFSIAAWLKPTNYDTDIVDHIVTRRGPGYQYALSIYDQFDNGNYCLYGQTEREGVGHVMLLSEPVYVNLNNWYFGVYVFDGTNYRLYFQGGEVDNELNSPIDPPSMSVSLYFGTNAVSGGYFIGLIDEVRIYNRVLSESEIQQLYNQGSGNQPPNEPSVSYNKNDQVVITATDPDEDKIKYGIDWESDGTFDQWTVLVSSGTEQRIDCNSRKGTIRVIAEDEHGDQSDWISVQPKNKSIEYRILNMLFKQLLQSFHFFEKILKQYYY